VEEPVVVEAVIEALLDPEFEPPQPEAPALEAEIPEPDMEIPVEAVILQPEVEPIMLGFLTPEEASVFAEPSRFIDPKHSTHPDEPAEPRHHDDPGEPRDSTDPQE
jgi:hypothetical protein